MTGAPGASNHELEAWAASGAMALTGRPGGPGLGPPPGFVARLRAVGETIARCSSQLGRPVDVDVLALLGERAALAGLRRGGAVSCGGAARLLPTADGWLAVNLPRPDDLDLVPAWLADLAFPTATASPDRPEGGAGGWPERITHRNGTQSAPAPLRPVARRLEAGPRQLSGPPREVVLRPEGAAGGVASGVWAAIARVVATGGAEPLAERARLLGLAVAALPGAPEVAPTACGPLAGLPVAATAAGAGVPLVSTTAAVPPVTLAPLRPLGRLLVVDLSSLWAGPLCTHLLQAAGARVVKVESIHRPDGARLGPAAFFDLLHAGQESVAVDFRTADGRAALRRLIEAADVVVEGSRPRALEQLGISAEAVLWPDTGSPSGAAAAPRGGPRVWLSITGYGRTAPGRDWVAFGDDAAVAGGLVARDDAGPCFLADAVADPCAGLAAAAATLAALAAGGRWLLDVSLGDVAAHLAAPSGSPAGSTARGVALPPAGLVAEPPRARTPKGRAPLVGEHTDALLAELCGH